jgi:putative heme-binding domain-containing protein
MGRWAEQAVNTEPLSRVLSHKAMRRLCDTRKTENLDLALDFLTKIKGHDVLLAHALDGLEKGQEGGIIKPTKDFSPLFAELANSKNDDVRKHAQNLATLWGDKAAIQRIVADLLNTKPPEAQRLTAVQTLRKVKSETVSAAFLELLNAPESHPKTLVIEVIRASADAGGDAFIAPLTQLAASKDYGTQLAAFGVLTNRENWTHALLDAIEAKKISAVGFPASVRRQLATSKDKAIRDHAFKVLGAWKDSSDDVKALIAAKKKACLEGEPDLAQGKLLFQTTCMVCHVFHGGGQKVGPDLIGSGRSNLDAILSNVIDPNQIIGNGYENVIVTTKDKRTLMGRVTEDTPSHVKLLAIGGAETVVPRDQVAKVENTHQSLMPMGFGGLPDDQFRSLIWYVLAPPEEGPLTADKKKLLSTSIDATPAKPKGGTNWRAIDWESVNLWNPKWAVSAPDFERTPVKLADYHGRSNVLLMHPFPDKKTPASLEQKLTVDATRAKLKFSVAADDRGDWKLVVKVGTEAVKSITIDHEKPRWKDLEIDLANYAGKEVTVRLEAHSNDWSWEFSYWNNVRWE